MKLNNAESPRRLGTVGTLITAIGMSVLQACGGTDRLAEPDQPDCDPNHFRDLPVTVLRGDVYLAVKGITSGRNIDTSGRGYDLVGGDSVNVTYCDDPRDTSTTFELTATPFGETVDADGNRVVIKFGPKQSTDYRANGKNGEEVFGSTVIVLGFSGPEGQDERFNLTSTDWQY